MQQLNPLVGQWKGTGTLRKAATEEPIAWTGLCSALPILDGQYIQQDLTITQQSDDASEQHFRTILGWCNESKAYVVLSMDGMGAATISHGKFADSTLTVTHGGITNGDPTASRWIQKLKGKGNQTMRMESLVGDKPLFVCFDGTFQRTDANTDVAVEGGAKNGTESNAGTDPDGLGFLEASMTTEAPSLEELEPLDFLRGIWTVDGRMAMNPDERSSVQVKGRAVIGPVLNGAALCENLQVTSLGDDAKQLKRHVYYSWNQTLKCYDVYTVCNSGQIGHHVCSAADGTHLSMASACMLRSQPFTSHAVLTKRLRDGEVQSLTVESQSRRGTKSPFTICDLKYERRDR
jgi:hypothetical protein